MARISSVPVSGKVVMSRRFVSNHWRAVCNSIPVKDGHPVEQTPRFTNINFNEGSGA